MFNLGPRYLGKKGFTLIELILGIAIMSMIIIIFYTVLSFDLRVNEMSLLEDEILLNGRYVLEYLKEEIISADRIVCSNRFENLDIKFPTNIGFVIVKVIDYEKLESKKDDNKKSNTEKKEYIYKEKECNYITYYFKEDSIIRISGKAPSNIFPYVDIFKGYNQIGESILEASKITLQKDNLVRIELSLGKDKKEISNFKSNIIVRCPVVRWYEILI